MHVYKTFFKILRKYKLSILAYAGVVFIMIMALSADTATDSVVQKKYTLIIKDEDDSEYSRNLVSYLGEKHYLKKGSFSDEQIKDMLYYQNISEYIVIPEGFGENMEKALDSVKSGNKEELSSTGLLNATYDAAMPRGIFINMQIDQYLNALVKYMAKGKSLSEASDKVVHELDTERFVSIKQNTEVYGERIYTMFLFLPFGIISIIFSGVIPVIMSFNEKEKKNRSIISATSQVKRNISLVFGAATMSILVSLILVVGVGLRSKSEYLFTNAWWLSVLNVLVYTIVATLLMSMVTSLPLGIRRQETADPTQFITVIISLTFSFLGGSFVDLTILGDKVAKIGRFIPNYWYSIASRKIWYDNASLQDVLGCYGLQLLFGLVCFSIGLAFTRYFGNRNAS